MLIIEMIMTLYDPEALCVEYIEPIRAVCLYIYNKYVYLHIYLYINLQASQSQVYIYIKK